MIHIITNAFGVKQVSQLTRDRMNNRPFLKTGICPERIANRGLARAEDVARGETELRTVVRDGFYWLVADVDVDRHWLHIQAKVGDCFRPGTRRMAD